MSQLVPGEVSSPVLSTFQQQAVISRPPEMVDRAHARTGRLAAWANRHGVGVIIAIPPIAAVVGFLSLRESSVADIANYGLIQALRPGYFFALALLTLGFVAFLTVAAGRPRLGILYIVTLTALVDGAPFVIEGAPRFPVTYVHAGFTEAIMRIGETLPMLDARFSWPGFFSLFGYLNDAAGLPDTMLLATWFPFVIKALWLAAMWVVLRRIIRNPAACWLALWLFEVIEWSGQAYFSPQALGVFIYLVCVAVLVVAFDPKKQSGPANRLIIAVGIAAYAGLVVSHQLSPFMVIAVAGVLGVLGLTRARSVWVIFVVIFVVWFSFGTTDYWIGHLSDLFSDVGKVSDTLSDNVGERVRGNVAHERVVYTRMALTALSWTLAGLGVLIAWRRKMLDVRIIVLGGAPLLSLGLQGYGGEGLIRVFLFVLPAASAAGALVFTVDRRGWRRALVGSILTVTLMVLIPLSIVAKYGGESFESVSEDELRAAAWVHQNAQPDDLVASIAPAGFLRSKAIGSVDYVPALDRFETGNLDTVLELMSEHDGRRFLVVTRSQFAYGTYVSGLPEGWETDLLEDLDESPLFRLVHRDGESLVYLLKEEVDARTSQ